MTEQRNTSRLSIVVILGIGGVLAGILAMVLLLSGEDRSTSAPVARPVMPGHGLVMPSDVHPAVRAGRLDVAVGDYWFKPGAMRLRAGAYRMVAHNYGVVGHDLMVERMPIKFSAPNQPVDGAAPFGVDDLMPGTTKTTRLVLTPGRWEFFCSVGGHYLSGQHMVVEVYGRMPASLAHRGHGGGMGTGMGMGTN